MVPSLESVNSRMKSKNSLIQSLSLEAGERKLGTAMSGNYSKNVPPMQEQYLNMRSTKTSLFFVFSLAIYRPSHHLLPNHDFNLLATPRCVARNHPLHGLFVVSTANGTRSARRVFHLNRCSSADCYNSAHERHARLFCPARCCVGERKSKTARRWIPRTAISCRQHSSCTATGECSAVRRR
jgi:hypothetical protein